MIGRLLSLCLLAWLVPVPASAQDAPAVTADEWAAYKDSFVDTDGRVIDDANGNISHSEGQGYGLLLAWYSGNRAEFELIWSFTRDSLLLRDDGLAVWKWDPAQSPPVSDPNNASDGDLLIAYALSLAGTGWNEPKFTSAARRIAGALARTSLFEHDGRVLLRPGISGFGAGEQEDGPVVNPSYWVFEALPAMAELAPEADWGALSQGGLSLLRDARFGARKLPPDWLSLGGEPSPAQGFPAEFGYNALRIPLYLMRAGDTDRELLREMRDAMTGTGGTVALVDLEQDAVTAELDDPGYRIIPALADCVLDTRALPAELRVFRPTVYYPSTLHLLALAHARKEHPACL